MRVLILWANNTHPNLGVAALGEGAKELAVRAFGPDTDVRFHGTGAPELISNDGPLNISRLKILAKAALHKNSEFNSWLKGFDVIIDMRGGDSFTDIYGLKRQIKTSFLSWIAPFYKIPVVFGPQTIGPFNTLFGKLLGFISLRRAQIVLTRDPKSYAFSKQLLRTPDNLVTDVVFALPHRSMKKKYDVLLNVSGLLWDENPHVDYLAYRELIHTLISQLQAKNRTVTLIPHVLREEGSTSRTDNDIYPLTEVLLDYPDLNVVTPTSLAEVREILGSANLVIGSRMHACLNAISMGTPAIALAYSRKFNPLLKQIHWKYTFDLTKDRDIVKQVISIVQEHNELESQAQHVRAYADQLVETAVCSLRKVIQ